MKSGCFLIVILYARLCVIGLAPTHVAFKDEGGITAIDFNVGKSDRSGIKVTGKRKKVSFISLSLSIRIILCIVLSSFRVLYLVSRFWSLVVA